MNFTLEQAMEKFPQIKHWQDEYLKANTTSDERLMKMPAVSCPTCEAMARSVMLDQTSHDTRPQPAAPAIPEGWKLVPMEPTGAMVQAAHHLDLSYMPGQEGADRAAIYRAMLAAAPTPRRNT